MITKRRAFFGIIICTFFMAAGATISKLAADSSPGNIIGILTHAPIYFAVFIYGIGAFFLIWSLKYGELSTLYPLIGLNFVWVIFTSIYIIGEKFNMYKTIGTLFILIGVLFMGIHTVTERWKHHTSQSLQH